MRVGVARLAGPLLIGELGAETQLVVHACWPPRWSTSSSRRRLSSRSRRPRSLEAELGHRCRLPRRSSWRGAELNGSDGTTLWLARNAGLQLLVFRQRSAGSPPIVIVMPRALQSSSARSRVGRHPLGSDRNTSAGSRASLATSWLFTPRPSARGAPQGASQVPAFQEGLTLRGLGPVSPTVRARRRHRSCSMVSP